MSRPTGLSACMTARLPSGRSANRLGGRLAGWPAAVVELEEVAAVVVVLVVNDGRVGVPIGRNSGPI